MRPHAKRLEKKRVVKRQNLMITLSNEQVGPYAERLEQKACNEKAKPNGYIESKFVILID